MKCVFLPVLTGCLLGLGLAGSGLVWPSEALAQWRFDRGDQRATDDLKVPPPPPTASPEARPDRWQRGRDGYRDRSDFRRDKPSYDRDFYRQPRRDRYRDPYRRQPRYGTPRDPDEQPRDFEDWWDEDYDPYWEPGEGLRFYYGDYPWRGFRDRPGRNRGDDWYEERR